jgi:DNA-directed RNA polymerase subunit K/omega
MEKESQESPEEVNEEDEELVVEDEVEPGEHEVRTKQFPSNKYELAIVAAQEARRMNDGWKDEEGQPAGRVTDVALERVMRGDVHYTFEENKD